MADETGRELPAFLKADASGPSAPCIAAARRGFKKPGGAARRGGEASCV
ncbi:hypothetical protein NSA36_03040 [Anaerotruncus colihominis]|nr:hypothetical protein [Anaerotruncus colihominis]